MSWPGKRGVLNSYHIYVISRSLPVADNLIDEDGTERIRFKLKQE